MFFQVFFLGQVTIYDENLNHTHYIPYIKYLSLQTNNYLLLLLLL